MQENQENVPQEQPVAPEAAPVTPAVPPEYQQPYQQPAQQPEVPKSLITVTQIVYLLHGASIVIGLISGAMIITAFVFGWPSIIAVIINYVKRGEAKGTYLESHFSWQIRTFWYSFLWVILVVLLGLLLIPLLGLGLVFWFGGFIVLGIWVCYRIIRGWLRLADGKPMIFN